jgi:hypothetical protein
MNRKRGFGSRGNKNGISSPDLNSKAGMLELV